MKSFVSLLTVALWAASAFAAPSLKKKQACRPPSASSASITHTAAAPVAPSNVAPSATPTSVALSAPSHSSADPSATPSSVAHSATSSVAHSVTSSVAHSVTFSVAHSVTPSNPPPSSATPSATSSATPSVAPSVAPAPAPSSAASHSGSKRGLSFNDASLIKGFNSGEVSWAYDWDSSYSGQIPSGVNYFPMLWSAAPEHSDQWVAHANAAIAQGATYLLFINEPDLASQSNTSPADAAQQWMKYMQPFAGRAKLVSPAITNGAPPMGTGWMDDFLSECNKLGCTVDGIAAHIYDSATNVGYFQNYITSLGTRYKRDVLITEFGASGSVQQQQQFLETMIPFLDNLSSVTHYAWFMAAVGNLVNADGSLTSLGHTYVSA